MTPVSSFYSTRLNLPPSCIAFCPQAPTFFIVGTYVLESSEIADSVQEEDSGNAEALQQAQKRSGSLIAFEISSDGGAIEELQTLQLDGGVLDIQWQQPSLSNSSSSKVQILAVATSTGLLQIYTLDSRQKRLSHLSTFQVCDPETLVLSLQWHPHLSDTVGVTLSDGRVCLVCSRSNTNTDSDGDISIGRTPWSTTAGIDVTTITTHELEAWWLVFSSFPSPNSSSDCDPQVQIYSGGDDARLGCTLLPNAATSPSGEASEPVRLWQDRKIHQAGVTYILPLTADLILTGSYDDHLRLLSVPAQIGAARPKVLAEVDLGGGVWRLKVLEGDVACGRILILASCMYAGARVVRLTREQTGTGDSWTFDVVARFEEHQSMNYGSDVFLPSGITKDSNGETTWTVISTSFYDKLMCLWKIPANS